MSLQTAADIPLQITSENASAERRVTPSWTVAQLKTKLEPVTGIPPSAQKLVLKLPDQNGVVLEAEDEESVRLGRWPLQPYAEIIVRPRDILALGWQFGLHRDDLSCLACGRGHWSLTSFD